MIPFSPMHPPWRPPKEVEIPAGLTLQLDLPELVYGGGGGRCGSGEHFVTDLKNRGRLLAPKGSVASGRVILLERYPIYFLLHIQFQDLDWPGGHAGLKLSFDRTAFATSSDRTAGRRRHGHLAPSRPSFKRYPHVLEIGISDSSFERHRRLVRAGLRLFAKTSA